MTDGLFCLDGRVAVVTGAVGLLGREHCLALGRSGAHVVAADLDEGRVETLVKELTDANLPRAIGVAVDVTQPASVANLRDEVLRRFGVVHVLINNAAVDDKFESPSGAVELAKFEHYPLGMWEQAMRVNVTGMFLCCQLVGTELARRGSGSIINIASTYGIVAPDQNLYRRPDGTQAFFKSPAYPTTKGAVLSFTRYLAAYWGSCGVRVNALSPGGVLVDQDPFFVDAYSIKTPLGRMARPSDYHGALVFLASDASSYMTGANLVVDGGWTAW